LKKSETLVGLVRQKLSRNKNDVYLENPQKLKDCATLTS